MAGLPRQVLDAPWRVLGPLAVAVAAGWAWLGWMAAGPSVVLCGPGSSPWAAGGPAASLAPLAAMWVVMMAAMMLPSAAPAIGRAIRNEESDTTRQGRRRGLAFAGGYLVPWILFSVVAAGAHLLLARAGWLSSDLMLRERGWRIGVLALVGLYQLTPMRRRCLRACRKPMDEGAGPQAGPGLGGGLRHGAQCIGCCGPLMLLLFVGGVMSLAWNVGLTAWVLAEKSAPGRWLRTGLAVAPLVGAAAGLVV